jgi:hypothetical protein
MSATRTVTLCAAGAAALASLVYLAAEQAPDPDAATPRIAYALLIAAGPAPEEGDSGITLDWPTDAEHAVANEVLVRVPVSPDVPVIVRPLATYLIPRGSLPDGITVEVWPGGSHWQCATALPGSTGCEALTATLDGEEWQPARPCSHLAPGRWRGECSPRPCSDVSELPLGSSMPVGCGPPPALVDEDGGGP